MKLHHTPLLILLSNQTSPLYKFLSIQDRRLFRYRVVSSSSMAKHHAGTWVGFGEEAR
jgi:hypothetical protein